MSRFLNSIIAMSLFAIVFVLSSPRENLVPLVEPYRFLAPILVFAASIFWILSLIGEIGIPWIHLGVASGFVLGYLYVMALL